MYIIRFPFFIYLVCFSASTYSFECDINQALEGATLDYPPYEYLQNGKATGIAVEVIQEASRRAGFRSLTFSFYPWKRAVGMVKSGEKDFLFNAGKNRERQKWGYYSKSILILQKYVLFKRKDDNIAVNNHFNNVADYNIAVRRGYLYGTGPFRYAIDNKKFNHVYFSESTTQSIALLLKNRIDLFIGDYLPVMHYLEQNGLRDKVDIISVMDKKQEMVVLTWATYVLFSKQTNHPDCVVKFDRAMKAMKQDGSYDSILKKYEIGRNG